MKNNNSNEIKSSNLNSYTNNRSAVVIQFQQKDTINRQCITRNILRNTKSF